MKLSITNSEKKEIITEIQHMLDETTVDIADPDTPVIMDLPTASDILSKVLEYLGVEID